MKIGYKLPDYAQHWTAATIRARICPDWPVFAEGDHDTGLLGSLSGP
jgi:hypothetical protein